MRKLALTAVLALAMGCAPSKQYTEEDVPKLPKLGDVMWAMAQAVDPQFKKIGRDSYTDEDYAGFVAAADRVRSVSARMRKDFSTSAEFGKYTDELAKLGNELGESAYGHEAARASKSLDGLRTTCRACHKALR